MKFVVTDTQNLMHCFAELIATKLTQQTYLNIVKLFLRQSSVGHYRFDNVDTDLLQ